MQTKEQIEHLLEHQYNSTHWKAFLSALFTNATIYSNPIQLTGINATIASQALQIGSIALNENGIARNIAVYEVALAQNIVLERNRVGLRNLLKTHWKDHDAAFIVYYQADSLHPDAKKWRFSYVSELKKFNEADEYVANNTEPKRYTYVLGEGERCRTARDRFYTLQQKANKATLDDIKEAFSVEKLSKTFFADYKDHYQDFVQFLTGKRLIKVGGKWVEQVKQPPDTQLISVFNNNEKDVRDFCKKLLGRIVFLYFIQKKGWLGVPLAGEWGSGKPDFMSRLLANCANPAIFYSQYLSKLFFETLNQKRDNDLAEIIAGEPTKIPYLNGGLFEEDNPKHRDLVFETHLFEKLFDFFDRYNFTIYEDDPNDHTVAVDPEMLGHIFENLLEDNKDKGAFYTPKEIVHYMCQESLIEYLTTWFTAKSYQVTPDNFVSFDNTVQTSFISANEGRTGQGMLEITQATPSLSKVINRSLIEKLLKKQLSDDDKLAVVEHANEFNEALDKVKICDPAIGSGAFPMGLLQEIFTAKQTIHTFVHGDLSTFEPASIKLNIIQNSIYGVDIEHGAVDIARLRFWLSLVVDEPAPQALPNLDYKIVVGNSLISKLGDDVIEIDWDVKKKVTLDMFGAEEAGKIKQTLTELTQLQKDFFNPSARKKDHATQIRNLKIELLINQLNLMIETQGLKHRPRKTATLSQVNFVAQTELYLQTLGWISQIAKLEILKTTPDSALEFFDWSLNFAEIMNKDVAENGKVGFDIVIGNPPYVRQERLGQLQKNQLKFKYPAIANGTADLYVYFFGLGMQLLKVNGVLNFITLNKYLKTLYGLELRNELENSYDVDLIIDFFELPVFDEASTDASITKIINSKNNRDTRYYPIKTLENLDLFKITKGEYQSVIKDETEWKFIDKSDEILLGKFNSDSISLKDFTDDNFYYGIKTGANHIFIIDENIKNIITLSDHISNEIIHDYIIPKDIKAWHTPQSNKYIIGTFPALNIDIEKYQGVKNYLMQYKTELEPKPRNHSGEWGGRKQGSYKWFETQDSISYHAHFTNKKIVYIHTAIDHQFCFDTAGRYINNSCYMISSDSHYLFFFLNSKLFKWFKNIKFVAYGDATESGRAKLDYNKMTTVPIKNINVQNKAWFERLYEKIILDKNDSKNTANSENQANYKLYKLYNLTFDEVKRVDPEFALTVEEYNLIILE